MSSVSYPTVDRNYCVFDDKRVNSVVLKREQALPEIENALKNPSSEAEVVERLYELNLMLDNGVKGVDKLYPSLSRYNDTRSPNIQTYLAGVYRKTKVPDAFGPLCSMLIRNSVMPPQGANFDPNEEIGGAILDYLV